jgi:hypothetical protein
MEKTKSGKAIALELHRSFEELLELGGLIPEVEYRIARMADRLPPILEKMYLKTETGRAAILKCAEKTEVFKEHLNPNEDRLFYYLTDLEKFYQEFIKTAYLFHVQAP